MGLHVNCNCLCAYPNELSEHGNAHFFSILFVPGFHHINIILIFDVFFATSQIRKNWIGNQSTISVFAPPIQCAAHLIVNDMLSKKMSD